MATKYSYSAQTVEWIERAIQSFADALSYESDADLAAERSQVVGFNFHSQAVGYDVKNNNDASHLQRIFFRYRDLLAAGSVYMILYKNGKPCKHVDPLFSEFK